jgi:hypothetical protein
MKHAKQITDAHGVALLEALRGIDTSTAMIVLSAHTSGIDWRGCTKGHVADAYAKSMRGEPFSHLVMRGLDLETIRRRALARQAGDSNWRVA